MSSSITLNPPDRKILSTTMDADQKRVSRLIKRVSRMAQEALTARLTLDATHDSLAEAIERGNVQDTELQRTNADRRRAQLWQAVYSLACAQLDLAQQITGVHRVTEDSTGLGLTPIQLAIVTQGTEGVRLK